MSGIAGALHPRGNRSDVAGVTKAMLASLAHRGPQGAAAVTDGPVALGRALLDGTGRDGLATQGPGPRRLRPDGPVLTADLRLDAAADLAARLGLPPGTPDPDLVLHAYDRWGIDLVAHIDGDFALAIWDPARRELCCMRDRFGVKPFYHRSDATGFRFASEPAAILAALPSRPPPDPVWVAEYLTGIESSVGRTAHAGIETLEPGHVLRTDGQAVTRRRYWTLTPAQDRPRDVAPALREALAGAVTERLEGGAAGAMLSGGLDSSAIACLGAGRGPEGRLPVFSMVFEDFPEVDERSWIDAVLAQGGFAPHRIAPSVGSAFADPSAVMAEQQQPHSSMGLPTTRRLYARASEAGLRVLLNGHGGDEVMSDGIERLIELAGAGRWAALWRAAGGAAPLTGQGRADMVLELLSAHAPPRIVRALARRLRGAAVSHDRTAWRRIVAPGLVRDADIVARRRAAEGSRNDDLPLGTRMHIDRITRPGMTTSFEVLDRTAARQGVEPRYPFFDRRVVELCVSQPASAKLRDGWTRALLRDAMQGILPEAVRLRRDKADFWPVGQRMLHHPRSLQRIDALAADPGAIADYVDVDRLRDHIARLHRGETEPAMLFELWRAVWLSVWLGTPITTSIPVPAPDADPSASRVTAPSPPAQELTP